MGGLQVTAKGLHTVLISDVKLVVFGAVPQLVQGLHSSCPPFYVSGSEVDVSVVPLA